MPQVIYTDARDEITDLVEKVRGVPDRDVALVLNPNTTGFQTPLNVRLLHQLGARAGKTVSVISGDAHIQELSRFGGLPTYASVPAFERGIQTVRPHTDDGAASAAAAGAMAYAPTAPPPPPGTSRPLAAPATGAVRTRPSGRHGPLYFLAIAAAVAGLVLFLLAAPSAKVTITLVGTPLSISPTIQGTPNPAGAGQADHIVTAALSSTKSAQFSATPTGTQVVPATKATGTVTFQSRFASAQPYPLIVNPREQFNTVSETPPLTFVFTGTQPVTIMFPANDGTAFLAGTPALPVQAELSGAAGNVAKGDISAYVPSSDPCANASNCKPGDFVFANAAPTTGGTDAKSNVVAAQGDLNNWNSQVTQNEQALTTQVTADLQNQAAGKTVAKDPGGNGTSVTCAVTPPLPAANAPFATAQETVSCVGNAAAYNPGDIAAVVKADLQAQVAQGDALATNAINCTTATVTQAAPDGTIALSIQCTSYSMPGVNIDALKKELTGRTPGDARNIVEHRLAHVQNVSVSQSPIPFFWLPLWSNRIEIDEAFVTKASP